MTERLPNSKYSVLLYYGNSDETDDHGAPETFYTFVEAPTPKAAVKVARRELLAMNGYEVGEDAWPARDVVKTFPPLLVVDGWRHDLRGCPKSTPPCAS